LRTEGHGSPVAAAAAAAARRRGTARRGATMVELLVSLAIAAALLTATAVAMDASLQSFRINQEQSTLTQRARMAMHRVLSGIRAGEGHLPYSATARTEFRNGLAVVDDTGIEMRTADGSSVTYRYDAAADRVLVDVGGRTHVLLEGVDSFVVRLEPMKSTAHVKAGLEYDLLRRATILLTVRATDQTNLTGEARGDMTITMSSSAMPRRNAW
jgi:type II secretory pathway pseudopilin PulG